MPVYPSYLETQRQNELRKIEDAQRRLSYIDQQQQMQSGNAQTTWQFPNQFQNAQSNMIIGKVVNDFSEITANDVPMNGNAAFFPKADGSELQVRSWASNGTIQTVVYKPVLEQNQAEATNTPQMDFNALNEDVRALREDIIARLDRLEQSMAVPTAKAARGKKGEAENE